MSCIHSQEKQLYYSKMINFFLLKVALLKCMVKWQKTHDWYELNATMHYLPCTEPKISHFFFFLGGEGEKGRGITTTQTMKYVWHGPPRKPGQTYVPELAVTEQHSTAVSCQTNKESTDNWDSIFWHHSGNHCFIPLSLKSISLPDKKKHPAFLKNDNKWKNNKKQLSKAIA